MKKYQLGIKYKEDDKAKNKDTEFVCITDLPVSYRNIEAIINLGRKKWRIENEEFNLQKT